MTDKPEAPTAPPWEMAEGYVMPGKWVMRRGETVQIERSPGGIERYYLWRMGEIIGQPFITLIEAVTDADRYLTTKGYRLQGPKFVWCEDNAWIQQVGEENYEWYVASWIGRSKTLDAALLGVKEMRQFLANLTETT